MKKSKTPPPPSNKKIMAINKNGHFGSTIMEGMALGVGSSIGRKITDMVFDNNSEKQTPQPKTEIVYGSNNYCNVLNQRLNDCLSKGLGECSDLKFLIETHKCSNYADASNM